MIKISTITIFGFLVLLVASPFVAISQDWKNYFFMTAGLVIFILSILIRQELYKVIKIVYGAEDIKADTYVENQPQ